MIRRSGCSRGGRRCRRRRCRWRSRDWSATGGRSSRSRTISTRSRMPTGSCACRRWRGSAPAADRVQQVLAAAFGEAWSPAKVKELLEQAGSKKKNLADWLRDEFFKQHCALFGNRPFVWHIWDGQRDGFSALVNYHRLDRKTLEKLTYTYLGQDWVERQRAEVRDEVPGAEARLAAALELQRKLERSSKARRRYDIYVRWKELHEQPIGWEPDLNDGVRLNIRPFVEAGVLRAPFNIHWRKDRGKNPDGSRAAQRHPPDAGREARSAEAGRARVSETVLDRLVGVPPERARAYDPNVQVRAGRAAVAGRGGAVGSRSSSGSASGCRSSRSATTTRSARRGPAYWIRCVVARHDRRRAAGRARRSCTCLASAAARCGRWTAARRSWRRSPSCSTGASGSPTRTAGTGRSGRCCRTASAASACASPTTRTRAAALLLALDRLLDEPIDRLAKQVLDADFLHELVNPDPVRQPARVARRPAGLPRTARRRAVGGVRAAVQGRLRVRPDGRRRDHRRPQARRPRRAAGRSVWKRFAETPERYPRYPRAASQGAPRGAHRRATSTPGRRTTRRPRTSSATGCATSPR